MAISTVIQWAMHITIRTRQRADRGRQSDMQRNRLLVAIYLVALCAFGAPTREASAQDASRGTVQQALSTFLNAFDNLDWPTFQSCFNDHPTMFHPSAPDIRRVDTTEQFKAAWQVVFERIRKRSGRSSPPYMKLSPADLRIEPLSENVSLVTFHLIDGDTLSRRTIVFRHYPDGWKIVHIHASNLPLH